MGWKQTNVDAFSCMKRAIIFSLCKIEFLPNISTFGEEQNRSRIQVEPESLRQTMAAMPRGGLGGDPLVLNATPPPPTNCWP